MSERNGPPLDQQPAPAVRGHRGAESTSSSDASERVYSAILAMIASGEFPAGARLQEQALAERIGVSRTPVREALSRLAAEGVAELVHHKGAHVASFSPSDVVALYDLRARLEPQTALLAVPRLTPEELLRLADLHAQMRQELQAGPDSAKLSYLNNAFHAVFVEGCGNRHLAIAVKAAIRPAVVTRNFRSYSRSALERSMRHHAELLEAAEARDGEWASAVMRAHILAGLHATGLHIAAAAESDGAPSAGPPRP